MDKYSSFIFLLDCLGQSCSCSCKFQNQVFNFHKYFWDSDYYYSTFTDHLRIIIFTIFRVLNHRLDMSLLRPANHNDNATTYLSFFSNVLQIYYRDLCTLCVRLISSIFIPLQIISLKQLFSVCFLFLYSHPFDSFLYWLSIQELVKFTFSSIVCIFFWICYIPNYEKSESISCAVNVPTFCNSMDCSTPGFSVHGILQARILEWVAISYSSGSSQPRDRTCISEVFCIGRCVLYHQC